MGSDLPLHEGGAQRNLVATTPEVQQLRRQHHVAVFAALTLFDPDQGAKVIVADILKDEAERVAADIRAAGGEATVVKIDVTSEPEWVAVIGKAVSTHGRLDILVSPKSGMASEAAAQGRLATLVYRSEPASRRQV